MVDSLNINVKIEDLKTITCECGGEYFTQLILYKILPALYSSTGQEQLMAVPNSIKCASCGKVQGIENLVRCFKERDKEPPFKPILVKG